MPFVDSFYEGFFFFFFFFVVSIYISKYTIQKRVCRTVDCSISDSLEPLAHRKNLASLSLFFRCYFGRCSFDLSELIPLIQVGVPLIVLISWMVFQSLFLGFRKVFMSTASFLIQLYCGILCLRNAFG